MVIQHIKKQVIISTEAEVFIVYYWLELFNVLELFFYKNYCRIIEILLVWKCAHHTTYPFLHKTPFIEDNNTRFYHIICCKKYIWQNIKSLITWKAGVTLPHWEFLRVILNSH